MSQRTYDPSTRPEHRFSSTLWKIMEYILFLIDNGDYYRALRMSNLLLVVLPPPIKDQFRERYERVKKALTTISKTVSLDRYLTYRKRRWYLDNYCFEEIEPYLWDLSSELWKRGYLEEQMSTSFFDPSRGRKSGEGAHKGFDRMVDAKT